MEAYKEKLRSLTVLQRQFFGYTVFQKVTRSNSGQPLGTRFHKVSSGAYLAGRVAYLSTLVLSFPLTFLPRPCSLLGPWFWHFPPKMLHTRRWGAGGTWKFHVYDWATCAFYLCPVGEREGHSSAAFLHQSHFLNNLGDGEKWHDNTQISPLATSHLIVLETWTSFRRTSESWGKNGIKRQIELTWVHEDTSLWIRWCGWNVWSWQWLRTYWWDPWGRDPTHVMCIVMFIGHYQIF